MRWQPLAALTMLTALVLSNNRFGDVGAEALAPALSRLSQLQSLRLSCNSLSDDSLLHMAPALASLASLSELDLLRRSDFSATAVAQFRASVPGLQHIQ